MQERNLCFRCGIPWEDEKRKRNDLLCVSCRARPAKSIKFGAEHCIPWHGQYDVEDNPLLHGELFLPGERTCGHKDCCNVMHIQNVLDEI